MEIEALRSFVAFVVPVRLPLNELIFNTIGIRARVGKCALCKRGAKLSLIYRRSTFWLVR